MRRNWVLVARVAAAGFCRRKTLATRWTPALLRWARRGERVRAGASLHNHTHIHSHTQTHSQSSGGSWTMRLHLHFNLAAFFRASRSHHSVSRLYAAARAPDSKTLAAGKSSRIATRTLSSACTSWRKLPSAVVTRGAISRSARQSNHATRENVRTLLPIARASMRPRQIQNAQPSSRRLTQFSTRPLTRPSTRPPTRSSTRPFGHSMERVFAKSEPAKNSASGLPACATKSPVHLVWRAPSGKASPSVARAASSRESIHSTAVTPSAHTPVFAKSEPAKNSASGLPAWANKSPVDLVWRAPSDKASPSVARATNSRESMHTTAVTPSALTPPSASKTTERPIVCATALEPELADRLAADVIRRIDRRARIERERKGM